MAKLKELLNNVAPERKAEILRKLHSGELTKEQIRTELLFHGVLIEKEGQLFLPGDYSTPVDIDNITRDVIILPEKEN